MNGQGAARSRPPGLWGPGPGAGNQGMRFLVRLALAGPAGPLSARGQRLFALGPWRRGGRSADNWPIWSGYQGFSGSSATLPVPRRWPRARGQIFQGKEGPGGLLPSSCAALDAEQSRPDLGYRPVSSTLMGLGIRALCCTYLLAGGTGVGPGTGPALGPAAPVLAGPQRVQACGHTWLIGRDTVHVWS